VTARINTTVHNVGIVFDGTDGTAGRVEIIETSPPGSVVRTVELFLADLPEPIATKAKTALHSGRPVDVRVLGVYGAWTVAEASGASSFHLKSSGPIMAGLLPVA
jgi:hypothetical protein